MSDGEEQERAAGDSPTQLISGLLKSEGVAVSTKMRAVSSTDVSATSSGAYAGAGGVVDGDSDGENDEHRPLLAGAGGGGGGARSAHAPPPRLSFFANLRRRMRGEPLFLPRTLLLPEQTAASSSAAELRDGAGDDARRHAARAAAAVADVARMFPRNVIRNAKYHWWAFLPIVLFEQFRFFFNLYFLCVAFTQLVPALIIGYWFTYWGPLVFVLTITILKEAYDDVNRNRRDKEINAQRYTRLTSRGAVSIASADIAVGHLIRLSTGQRVPADMLLLATSSRNGASFIKTDQLDGETDWKLRHAVHYTQSLAELTSEEAADALASSSSPPPSSALRAAAAAADSDAAAAADASPAPLSAGEQRLLRMRAQLTCAAPIRDIYKFEGQFKAAAAAAAAAAAPVVEALSLDQTLWQNTTLTAGTAIGVVVYTGKETRAVMNTSVAPTKIGLFERELNRLSKVLFFMLLVLSLLLVGCKGFGGLWYIYTFRYIILFSSIIPISMRVNLDVAKTIYSWLMMRDDDMPNTIVRTSTIPEELGRVSYVLTDKTGTLTQNDMVFQRLHLGRIAFAKDARADVAEHLTQAYAQQRRRQSLFNGTRSGSFGGGGGGGGGDDDDDGAAAAAAAAAATASAALSALSTSPSPPTSAATDALAASTASLGGAPVSPTSSSAALFAAGERKIRRTIHSRVLDAVLAIALCHNVTPTGGADNDGGGGGGGGGGLDGAVDDDDEAAAAVAADEGGGGGDARQSTLQRVLAVRPSRVFDLVGSVVKPQRAARGGGGGGDDDGRYQASSPDEIALVRFAEEVGLRLVDRDFRSITLRNVYDEDESYDVLHLFPFSSARKRMGIIVRARAPPHTVTFYVKGADSVMSQMVKYNDWLDEECDNMARDGLRTLVFGKRELSRRELEQFASAYDAAKASMVARDDAVVAALRMIERDLELVGVTGVEDKLQHNVRGTLETLRNAGIRIWMLTGDKIETATCIAISSQLVARSQSIFQLTAADAREAVARLNEFSHLHDAALVIDGASLALCLEHAQTAFLQLATAAPSVVCCRCSPTQKATIVRLIKTHTGLQTLAVGDGGNDVSMIQAADVGVGIEGKEGRQASLASDFSLSQFSFLSRLLLWHGRNSYNRSARLASFIIHRGLVISFLQAVFSAVNYWSAISIFNGYLLVGYATMYTAVPVFALVLDEDITAMESHVYPELYHELQKGRSMSYKTFSTWTLVSLYQGASIALCITYLKESLWMNMVAISFTALLLAELFNVLFEFHHWRWPMFAAEALSVIFYVLSIIVLPDTFNIGYLVTTQFYTNMLLVTVISTVPVYAVKFVARRLNPPVHLKLR